MKNSNGTIFKTYSEELTQKNCANLLRSLAICGGCITDMFTIGRNFPEKTVGTWTCFYMLRFPTQAHHDKFVARGFELGEPETVHTNNYQFVKEKEIKEFEKEDNYYRSNY